MVKYVIKKDAYGRAYLTKEQSEVKQEVEAKPAKKKVAKKKE